AMSELFVGHSPRRDTVEPGIHSSRATLAEQAFPDLQHHAYRFRKVYVALISFLAFWLIFTALTYWDIALGNSILQRFDQLEHDKLAILQPKPALSVCLNPDGAKSMGDETARISCLQLQRIASGEQQALRDLDKYAACRGVYHLVFLRCWPGTNFVGRALAVRVPTNEPLAGTGPGPTNGENKGSIASIVSVFSAYVLPMMFGLLGTMV